MTNVLLSDNRVLEKFLTWQENKCVEGLKKYVQRNLRSCCFRDNHKNSQWVYRILDFFYLSKIKTIYDWPCVLPCNRYEKTDAYDDRGVWSTVGISALWHLDA